jgi:hypothetical protein
VTDISDVHGSLSDLYRGPLEEFVARRTSLAKATRATDRAAAATIGKARKPPVAVWAIDQLSIDDRNVLTELLAAAADASDMQRGIADQTETREGLVLASSRLREAVETAARAADAILETAGHASSEDVRRRVRATLHAAATGSGAEREALWQGTLDQEIATSGFAAVDTANDSAELTAMLAPLRHVAAHERPRPRVLSHESDDDARRVEAARKAREAAATAAEKLTAAAGRARDLATAKRLHADSLAEETRVAERDALAAEHAAATAEDAAEAARSALTT